MNYLICNSDECQRFENWLRKNTNVLQHSEKLCGPNDVKKNVLSPQYAIPVLTDFEHYENSGVFTPGELNTITNNLPACFLVENPVWLKKYVVIIPVIKALSVYKDLAVYLLTIEHIPPFLEEKGKLIIGLGYIYPEHEAILRSDEDVQIIVNA